MKTYITEPERQIPVIEQADLCVVGGSCTGVFAAVRAARLGLKVVLIEKHNSLGGTAVSGLVNIWHSIKDTDGKNQVIAGLTYEVIERLKQKDAVIVSDTPATAFNFNPWELTLILDQLVKENKITVLLHTAYVDVLHDNKSVQTILVENEDGRGAVQARFFIDATGGGRIARDLQIPSYVNKNIQPPTACFYLLGNTSKLRLGDLVRQHGKEFGLEDDWGWNTGVAGLKGISMRADNHVFDVHCDCAADLTFAEFEGRRQASALKDLLKKYGKTGENYALAAMCSHIGIRETVHFKTRFKANGMELLTGKRYDAPILNGTYRVDIHHSDSMGITFRYLDGREDVIYGKNTQRIIGNWREREGITGEPAKYYQLPFDNLIQEQYGNFIAVGRMLNADEEAFGALRVMVNLNQMGEAAGVAAYLCVHQEKEIQTLDGRGITETLREGGSIL